MPQEIVECGDFVRFLTVFFIVTVKLPLINVSEFWEHPFSFRKFKVIHMFVCTQLLGRGRAGHPFIFYPALAGSYHLAEAVTADAVPDRVFP